MPSSDSAVLHVLASPANRHADDNPYISSLYDAVAQTGEAVVQEFNRYRLVHGRYQIIHVHWPEYLVRWSAPLPVVLADVAKVIAAIALARRRGAKLVWTGHDLRPHERTHPRLFSFFTWCFDRQVDLVISLGTAATGQLHEHHHAVSEAPIWVVPHGHYKDSYPAPVAKETARRRLGLDVDAHILLTLGQIRRYKNASTLAREIAHHHPEMHLVVAGRVAVDAGLAGELDEIAVSADNVTIRLETIPTEDVSLYHSAADVVVLPYQLGSTLHSGAALLALSMSRPVVVPDTPAMRELQERVGGPSWVRTFDGGVPEAIVSAQRLLENLPEGEPDLTALDWPALGRSTVEAYRSVVDGRS